MKRREFLATSIGTVGSILPALALGQVRPCPPGTIGMVGGPTVTNTCGPDAGPSWLPVAQTVLDLGSIATTPNLASVTPSEWVGPLAGYVVTPLYKYFTGWSGGIGDPTTKRLYVHGGGHTSGAFNGVWYYDFSGSAAPAGWRLVPNSYSSVANATTAYNNKQDVLADGKPSAIHSYDHLWLDEANGVLFRTAGSFANGPGDSTSKTWALNLATGAWTQRASNAITLGASSSSIDRMSATDQTQRKTVHMVQSYYAFYRWDANSWSSLKYGPDIPRNQTAIYDSRRSQILMSSSRQLLSVSWSSETISNVGISLTGADASTLSAYNSYTGFFELGATAAEDCYWLFLPNVGSQTATVPSYLWRIQAQSPYLVTRYTLGGASVNNSPGPLSEAYNAGNSGGHYKRHCFVPEWRSVIFATGPSSVYALKLP